MDEKTETGPKIAFAKYYQILLNVYIFLKTWNFFSSKENLLILVFTDLMQIYCI